MANFSNPSSGLLWQCKWGNCAVVPPCFSNEISLLSVETFFFTGCSWTLPNCEFFEAIKFEVICNLYSHLKFGKVSLFCNVLLFFGFRFWLVFFWVFSYQDNFYPHWNTVTGSSWHGLYSHVLQGALLLNRLLIILPVTCWDNWCDSR